MSRKPSRYLLLALLLALCLPALKARAGSLSTTFGVTMTVPKVCIILTSGSYAFGNYDPVSANKTTDLTTSASNFVSVYCTKNSTSVWVGFDAGTNSAKAPAGSTRAVSDGSSDYIGYDFYQDNTWTTLWGNTQATGEALTGFTSAFTPVQATAYGKAPHGQDVPAGSYTDTITATVNF